MKNIRHIYRFHFRGTGINTTVEIKAQTLKDAYYKILNNEPSLQRLADRSWKVMKEELHPRRYFSHWVCRDHFRGFLPHEIMSEKDYNRVLNGNKL